MRNDSFLDKPEDDLYNLLGKFYFTTKDFKYDPDSRENIEFLEKKYTLNETHESAYFFKEGDRVVVTGDNVRVRDDYSTSSNIVMQLDKNTPLIVTGTFEYEKSTNQINLSGIRLKHLMKIRGIFPRLTLKRRMERYVYGC